MKATNGIFANRVFVYKNRDYEKTIEFLVRGNRFISCNRVYDDNQEYSLGPDERTVVEEWFRNQMKNSPHLRRLVFSLN